MMISRYLAKKTYPQITPIPQIKFKSFSKSVKSAQSADKCFPISIVAFSAKRSRIPELQTGSATVSKFANCANLN
jgi:hypothetical protein